MFRATYRLNLFGGKNAPKPKDRGFGRPNSNMPPLPPGGGAMGGGRPPMGGPGGF